MKYAFTVIIVLVTGFAKGQIVNIPDSNFKKLLVNYQPVIDINHDGEIQQSEALRIDSLYIGQSIEPNGISDLTGIQSFSNLKRFYCYSNLVTAINLNGLTQIENIQVQDNALLSTINLNGCASLDTLNCDGNNLLSIDVSTCVSLKYLSCSFNKITSITTGNLTSLKFLECGANQFASLDLSNCQNLAVLQIGGNPFLKRLDCHGLKNLEYITDFFTLYDKINYVDLSGCSKLTTFHFRYNTSEPVSVNLSGCTGLRNAELMAYNASGFESLDLSSCINLTSLVISAQFLKHLNLKNGSALTNYNIAVSDSASICIDDFEQAELSHHSSIIQPGNHISYSPYCSFFPGGNYNTIKGITRLDLDNNGCNNIDRGMPNVAIKIADTSGNSLIRYTAPSGDYAHYPYKGLFTLTPYFPYPYFTVNPSSATVSFDTANNLLNTTNFCIQPNGVHNDLEITFLPAWPPARPGFDAGYTLVYKNRGTTTLSGNLQVNFDNSKMNFNSASENIATQSVGQLSWNYSNLQPFESKAINVTFNLLPPPVNNIGDTITYLASITPSVNDETAFDNSFILPQRVIGSFDPNDKQCLEGSKLDISKIGDYLHYQIHFQNEGTDTAFNIVVADTLSDKLDWNSFELIGSSHPVNAKLTNNKAEFIFENIQLPYKAINEPASNGWLAFKIKPTPSVVIGDSLNNKAAIYFDFNKPVITNTATTIVSSASTPVPVKLEYFSVNSSNNFNKLNWKAACSYGSAKFTIERSNDAILFSNIGYITATSTRCQLPFNFTDNNPATGKNYYRLKIMDADGISFYSKTLVIGKNKAGLAIRAIANDIIYLSSDKQQTIQLKVIAADGKEILNEKKKIAAGNNNISLQMKSAAKGIYTLIIYTNEGTIITKRFVK